MAQATLDRTRSDRGARFATRLVEGGFPVAFAGFLYLRDLGEWRYFLETPVVRVSGLKKAYFSLDKASRVAVAEAATDADFAEEVHVLLPGSPIVAAIEAVTGSFRGVCTIEHSLVTLNPPRHHALQVLIDGAQIFYLDRSVRPAREVKRAHGRFDAMMDKRLAA